ncbi:MAG: acyl carrier protein [Lachnospiraceae bacterium]|nr:acyl carrier protein [Lachnospiraceae bacterium]
MMEQEILTILQEINPYIDINEESLLLKEEIIDSTGILVLITELEQKYKIEISFEKLQLENFQTVVSVAKMVRSLMREKNDN